MTDIIQTIISNAISIVNKKEMKINDNYKWKWEILKRWLYLQFVNHFLKAVYKNKIYFTNGEIWQNYVVRVEILLININKLLHTDIKDTWIYIY